MPVFLEENIFSMTSKEAKKKHSPKFIEMAYFECEKAEHTSYVFIISYTNVSTNI